MLLNQQSNKDINAPLDYEINRNLLLLLITTRKVEFTFSFCPRNLKFHCFRVFCDHFCPINSLWTGCYHISFDTILNYAANILTIQLVKTGENSWVRVTFAKKIWGSKVLPTYLNYFLIESNHLRTSFL